MRRMSRSPKKNPSVAKSPQAKSPATKQAAKASPPTPKATLAVLLDGKSLPDDEARALWTEFSQHMDEHVGDLAGFATKKGWRAVKPEFRAGTAVLVASTSQGPSS